MNNKKKIIVSLFSDVLYLVKSIVYEVLNALSYLVISLDTAIKKILGAGISAENAAALSKLLATLKIQIQNVNTAANNLSTGIVNKVGGIALIALKNLLKDAVNAVKATIANIITLLEQILAQAGADVSALVNEVKVILNKISICLDGLVQKVNDALAATLSGLEAEIAQIVIALEEAVAREVAILNTLLEKAMAGITADINAMVGVTQDVKDTILALLNELGPAVSKVLNAINYLVINCSTGNLADLIAAVKVAVAELKILVDKIVAAIAAEPALAGILPGLKYLVASVVSELFSLITIVIDTLTPVVSVQVIADLQNIISVMATIKIN